MAKAVKKIKTTYEAVQWEGLNEQEFDGWGVSYRLMSQRREPKLLVEFRDESNDKYHSEWLYIGDAVVRSSKGRTWVMNKDEYERKFEDV